MALTYSPILYVGKIYQEIFSSIVYDSPTFKQGLCRVIDDCKYEMNLTSFSGDIPIQAYASNLGVSGSYANDTLTIADQAVKPNRCMAYTEIDLSTLINTRFSEDMKAGAVNLTSNEYEQQLITFITPRISKSYAKAFWCSVKPATAKTLTGTTTGSTANQSKLIKNLVNGTGVYDSKAAFNGVDGILTKLVQSKQAINVSGTTLTVSNLQAQMAAFYNAIPAEIIASDEAYIYAPLSLKQLILTTNRQQAYRDIFLVTEKTTDGKVDFEITYNGLKFIFDYLPNNTMLAARYSDIVAAMDLLADTQLGNIQVEKLLPNSDILFIKAVMTLDTAVCSPQLMTLYC